ncbi:TPA: hypothetical protein DDZ86_03985 [Candidatus Dependentiae bacterium]|nr:hypothetical protein [Candidatus Dependentiae bacterium]
MEKLDFKRDAELKLVELEDEGVLELEDEELELEGVIKLYFLFLPLLSVFTDGNVHFKPA